MFDPFEFVANRNAGMKVSDQECMEFVQYNAMQAISMDPRYRNMVVALNTVETSHLPKDIQAKLCNGFNGRAIDTRWCRAKTSDIAARDKFIDKVVAVYGIPYNDAMENIRHGLINRQYVEEAYAIRFEGRAINPNRKR